MAAREQRPDRFWAVPAHRLVLTEWELDGTRYRELTFAGSAFPDRTSDEFQTGPAPLPFITDLHEDSAGLVWMRAVVPDPDYSPSESDPDLHYIQQTNREHDVLIEVLDPESKTVFASVRADRVDQAVGGLLPGRWGYRMSVVGPGFELYRFGRLSLGKSQEGPSH